MGKLKTIVTMCLLIVAICGCTRKDLPSVTTAEISEITSNTAKAGGSVLVNGADVTVRGVCYSAANTTPTVNDLHTTDGSGTGDFVSLLSGLQPNTTYYVRAYAMNEAGTAYGEVVSFTTLDRDVPLSPTQKLCIPRGWKLAAATSTPAYQMPSGSFISDLFDGWLYDFELDDIIIFKENGIEIGNPGSLIPEEDFFFDLNLNHNEFPFTESILGNWSFDNETNPQVIFMQIPFFYDSSLENCRIISLTENEFKISYTFNDNESPAKDTYTFTLTYTPVP